jgi:hypothetical protein
MTSSTVLPAAILIRLALQGRYLRKLRSTQMRWILLWFSLGALLLFSVSVDSPEFETVDHFGWVGLAAWSFLQSFQITQLYGAAFYWFVSALAAIFAGMTLSISGAFAWWFYESFKRGKALDLAARYRVTCAVVACALGAANQVLWTRARSVDRPIDHGYAFAFLRVNLFPRPALLWLGIAETIALILALGALLLFAWHWLSPASPQPRS